MIQPRRKFSLFQRKWEQRLRAVLAKFFAAKKTKLTMIAGCLSMLARNAGQRDPA